MVSAKVRPDVTGAGILRWPMQTPLALLPPLVLDTNIVLDLYAFEDPGTAGLRARLRAADALWLATAAMRDELARVLLYPAIANHLQRCERSADEVLARFDTHITRVEPAPGARWRCRDADDQKFIDLAVQRRALLLSRDKEVLRMRKCLAPLGVQVMSRLDALSKT